MIRDCDCVGCDGSGCDAVFASEELCEYCGRCLVNCCQCDREALKAQDEQFRKISENIRAYFAEKAKDELWVHPTIPARK